MPSGLSSWAAKALDHVASLSVGRALDRSLRITLNFHPDRISRGGTMLAQLADSGSYRSQFETGTSNGGLTAFTGGDRMRWERRIFAGAYDDAPVSERPKYGALNHRRRLIGGALRFGSAHLRLREHTLDRATFCFPDSTFEPSSFATAERFGLHRLADAFDATVRTELEEASTGGLLDDYIEAQVHGVVALDRDVEAIVLDPCYRDTHTETEAERLGVTVEWHEGRRLDVAELSRHPDFRGPGVLAVGERIAENGRLDAAVIGRAFTQGVETAQDLKKLWHLVARFGDPPTRVT